MDDWCSYASNEEMRPAGLSDVGFDAGGFPSGTYVFRVETATSSAAGAMTLVR